MKKRRYVWAVSGLLIAIGILAVCMLISAPKNIQRKEEQCRSIYEEIKTEAFSTGSVTGNTVVLYDDHFQELKQLSVERGLGKETVRIVKGSDQLRFVLGGSVDDEYGVLFAEGAAVDMSGLSSLKRLSGNSYYYETR